MLLSLGGPNLIYPQQLIKFKSNRRTDIAKSPPEQHFNVLQILRRNECMVEVIKKDV